MSHPRPHSSAARDRDGAGAGGTMGATSTSSYFEQQRGALVREIALSFEQVLQNMNRLNRNLESVIAVGNEFSSVEALWSQFENVMATDKTGDEEEEHADETTAVG